MEKSFLADRAMDKDEAILVEWWMWSLPMVVWTTAANAQLVRGYKEF